MKTKMKYLVGLALFLLTAMSVNAQQKVPLGATKTYRVTTDHTSTGPGYNYTWTIDQGGNTIAAPTAPQTTIQWLTPGTNVITLTEANSTGGCSTPNTFTVEVLDAAHVQFTSTTSASCADIAQVIPLSFTIDGSTAADLVQYPLVVNYTVDGVADSKTIAAAGDLFITVPGTARADKDAFANYTVSVVITSATAAGYAATIDANTTNTNTVYDIPELNPIIAVD